MCLASQADNMNQYSTAAFLNNGGQVGELMRSSDWSTSPLGLPQGWPQSLRSVTSLILSSKFPMFIAWGPELALVYNDAYMALLGDKHPSALGQPLQRSWTEIWPEILPFINLALKGGASFHQNVPFTIERNGYSEESWFTYSYSSIRNEAGEVGGIYCACIETTAQVLSERHRADESRRLRELFQQAPGLMAVVREPGHVFEMANNAYLQLVGQRELVGRSMDEALPEVKAQGFIALLDEAYRSGLPYRGNGVSVMLQRQAGEPLEERFIDFVFQPIRDHHNQVSGIFIQGSDVTEMVKAHRALSDSERRLRQLANTIPHLAWMANAAGDIHWYNDRWYEYTGKTLEQMQGPEWQSVHDPAMLPEVTQLWKTSIATGTPFEATFPMLGANGQYRTFFTRAAPLRDASDTIVQWFGTNTDVTALELAKKELKDASGRKDEFLAMLAHELRNPLAPISTAAELLKLERLEPKVVHKTSHLISRQVAHMTKLVDDLLDVSRVTRGLVSLELDVVDVNSVVAEALEQTHALVQLKGHQVSSDLPLEPAFVHGDRTRLVQVFTNILSNAAKYTPKGGHIALRVRQEPDEVEFAVQDHGIGMAPDLLPHVFELFTQGERSPDRSQGGLGLGLALVKSLVALHHGSVSARSDGLGKGSEFVVRLPRVTPQKDEQSLEAIADLSHQADAPLQLLVVDDNEDAAQTLGFLLEALGHQVAVAFTGSEGLRLARELPPALAILDIGLPDMDGYELARQFRAAPALAGSTLVALTGYGQPKDKEAAMHAGFDHHLVKPLAIDALLAIISKVQSAQLGF